MAKHQWEVATKALTQNAKALKQTDAAFRSRENVESSTNQFRLDQRAWISIEEMRLLEDVKAGSRFNLAIELRNVGKTPARHMKLKWTLDVAVAKPALSFTDYGGFDISLAPQAHFTHHARAKLPFSEADAAALEFGSNTLTVSGEVTYFDVFEKTTRHTRFCGVYIPANKPLLSACEHGSYIDWTRLGPPMTYAPAPAGPALPSPAPLPERGQTGRTR